VIFGAGDRFLNLFAGLQRLAPVLPLAGAACRFQPVWVEDVAEAIVRCLDNPRTAGTIFELAGPDVLTLAELVRGAARWSGAPLRPIVPLPAPLARAQAWLMERAPGEPLMSRDNLDSMQVDNVARGAAPGLAELGITAASLAAVAPTYLGHRGPRSGLDERRRTRA
jgi:NADH dehydrogenase